VMNVLAGERYKIVPNEVKDYVRGKYGRSPVPITKEFIKKILGKEKPIGHRPADDLEPMLPAGAEGVNPKLIEHEEDIISYILLPEPASQFLSWRALPPEQRPPTPADLEIKRMKEEIEQETKAQEKGGGKAEATKAAPAPALSLPVNIPEVAKEILSKIKGLTVEELVFRKGNSTIAIRPSGMIFGTAAPGQPPAAASGWSTEPGEEEVSEEEIKEEPAAEKPSEPEAAEYNATIDAPFVGTLYLAPGPGKDRFIKEGDVVEAGAKVCIVEAMKLFNEITAPKKCRIVKILTDDGSNVDKGQPLIGVQEL
jgi:oxaloacetate decarboxylase alpha subunit